LIKFSKPDFDLSEVSDAIGSFQITGGCSAATSNSKLDHFEISQDDYTEGEHCVVEYDDDDHDDYADDDFTDTSDENE